MANNRLSQSLEVQNMIMEKPDMAFEAIKYSKPEGAPSVGLLLKMRKDPLRFFAEISRNYGDVVPLKLGLDTIYLINHPKHLKRIFQENRDNYIRSKYYRHLSPILGNGLFTLEGEVWKNQRKISQPSVSGPNLAIMVREMVSATKEMVGHLKIKAKENTAFDITTEAFHLKLDIVMRALFSTKLKGEDFQIVLNSLTVILREVEKRIWEIFPTPFSIPTNRNRNLNKAIKSLDKVIYRVVKNRLSAKSVSNDLLDMIITAEKDIGWNRKSLKSIRDQVVSVVLAGHETGANALAWLHYELARNPGIVSRIRCEANAVYGSRPPDFQSLQKLEFTHRVFKEALRLYPPLWTISRETVAEDYLGRHRIPKGAVVMLCPYTIQRHPNLWRNPEYFDPDRFLAEQEARRHQFAYFPFGGGPHTCLGNRFAALEGVLALAMICQKFNFELCPGQKIKPVPMTTLRPNNPIMMKYFLAAQAEDRMAA